MSARTGGDADRLIARLPEDRRRAVLDALARTSRPASTVLVEYGYNRKLDGSETQLLGRILGVAYYPGGGSADALIVEPTDTRRRMVAIPASQVLRVSAARARILPARAEGEADRYGYSLGEVLAGPPRPRPDTAQE